MSEAPINLVVPARKVGTPFQSPSWRAEALFHPHRFGMTSLCTEQKDAVRSRLGLEVDKLPEDLEDILFSLPNNHRALYLSLIDRKKTTPIGPVVRWNIKKVERRLNDPILKQAVLHLSGIIYNPDIAFALALGTDNKQGVMAKMLSYTIFLGKSDTDLYKEWRITPKRIAWYRQLFADFSHFPKDEIAKWSVLRQLTNNDTISEVDFNYFKRLSDIGIVALKAQCAFHTLTDDERTSMEQYLGNTAIVNVLNQHAAIRTFEDSHMYTKGVMEFAKLNAQKQHMRNVELTIRMNSAKLEQISASDAGNVTPEEQKLLDELHRRSLVNASPLQVKTIADLK